MSIRELFTETAQTEEKPVAMFAMRRTAAEPAFIIDGESRTITPPADFKHFGVESDEKTERVFFECPQIVGDNIDLTELNLYINYRNAKGELDKYYVVDVQSDGLNIRFSWELGRNVTRYKGNVSFVVCAVKTNDTGEIINEWNTTLCSGAVLEGLEVENPADIEAVSDLVDQLINVVANAQTEAVNAIYQAGNTAKVEISNVANEKIGDIEATGERVIAIIEDKNNQLANAVKATASGEVIRVDDVSPIEHIAKVKVSGKNLFNAKTIEPLAKGDLYVSAVEDGSITITSTENYVGNGFAAINKTLRDLCPQITAGKEYVLNATTPSNVKAIFLVGKSLVWQFGTGRLLTNELLDCNVVFYGYDSTIYGYGDCVISNIQMEEGTTATEYEPYINPETVTVTRYGTDESDNPETFTPDASGLVEIPSLSPTMTLLTDTDGANIELVYNQDTNVALDNVRQDLAEADRVIAEMSEIITDIDTSLDNVIAKYELGGDA